MKSRIGEKLQVPINYWALLLNQSSTKQALLDSSPTQCHLSSSSKLRFGAVRLRPKITDTVKGKLILGAKLLQAGGVEKVFKKKFSVKEGEKLLKASQCYLSTTSGPMPGLLFVSTHKLAFLSERSIKIPSSTGKSMRMHYKVSIPIAKIKRANESENLENPSEKYIQVVTEDHFEFCFKYLVTASVKSGNWSSTSEAPAAVSRLTSCDGDQRWRFSDEHPRRSFLIFGGSSSWQIGADARATDDNDEKQQKLEMKQNQIKSRIGESPIPINYWAVLLNQNSTKQPLPDSSATQCHLFSSSKLRFGAVRLRPKITDTVKGKLILGAKLLQAGGIEKVFNKKFSVKEGEKLLKASQCYLSTTSGPIPGLLFVSTHKLAFLSERSIKFPSSTGKSMRMHYKVSIPIAKIKRANESENLENPSEKYIQVVTEDHFEFWFMWFPHHQRTLKYLQNAISRAQYS
nr:GEM-like protein 4 [Ipomoea batatas]